MYTGSYGKNGTASSTLVYRSRRSPPKNHIGRANEYNQLHEEVEYVIVLKNGVVQQLLDCHLGDCEQANPVRKQTVDERTKKTRLRTRFC